MLGQWMHIQTAYLYAGMSRFVEDRLTESRTLCCGHIIGLCWVSEHAECSQNLLKLLLSCMHEVSRFQHVPPVCCKESLKIKHPLPTVVGQWQSTLNEGMHHCHDTKVTQDKFPSNHISSLLPLSPVLCHSCVALIRDIP